MNVRSAMNGQLPAAAKSRANPWRDRWQLLSRTLTFVRFSHTIFALPFALGSLLAASHGRPGWRLLILVVLAMVSARTAAMTFNRIADWQIDQKNPRTAGRHRLVTRQQAEVLLLAAVLVFVLVTYFINRLCFFLSLSPSGSSFSIH